MDALPEHKAMTDAHEREMRRLGGEGHTALPSPADVQWDYDLWPSGEPYQWHEDGRGGHADDSLDFHVDLGCGRLKKGRIGIDRFPDPGVNVVMDLDSGAVLGLPPIAGADAVMPPVPADPAHFLRPVLHEGLPFPDSSIESIISHHAMEHIGDGFIPLMDECYRVLKHGAPLRIIVPLFPSRSAVEDPDHKRYFMTGSFDSFCGTPGEEPTNCWLASFSTPYTRSRFEMTHKDYTSMDEWDTPWDEGCAREMRVTLKAVKE